MQTTNKNKNLTARTLAKTSYCRCSEQGVFITPGHAPASRSLQAGRAWKRRNPLIGHIQDPGFWQGLLAGNRSTHHRQAQGRQDQDRVSGKRAFLGQDLQAGHQEDPMLGSRQDACRGTTGNKHKTIKKAFKSMIRTQKTEGWDPGKMLAGMASEDPARFAPGKIPPPCHRSSAATSLSDGVCPPGCVSWH